jgi:hypothetical protein
MSKNFAYVRLITKSVSLPFIVLGVYLFLTQILPGYIGKGVLLWIFIAAGLLWAFDTLWSTLDDLRKISVRMK